MDTLKTAAETSPPKPPSGRDIWRALKEELTANLYQLPFSTLAPTVYHVYLHEDDFDVIESIVPRLASEIAAALTADVERLNRVLARGRGRLRTLLGQAEGMAPVEVPPGGWEIYIQPDHDHELPRGSIGIVSKLMVPAPPEYRGTPTVRTVRTVVTTDGRRASIGIPGEPTSAPPPAPADTSRPDAGGALPAAAAFILRATLTYHDDEGDHAFAVRKDLIKIGRGGLDTWVDVQVITSAKVSREHCWIRNGADGRFFIRDVSTWGTSVNGQAIPPPVKSPEGLVVEPGAESELPADARIDLGETLTITFHAEGRA